MRDSRAPRSQISLSELIRGLYDLELHTEAHKKALYHALGFDYKQSQAETIHSKHKTEIINPHTNAAVVKQLKQSQKPSVVFKTPPNPKPKVELPDQPVTSTLQKLPPESSSPVERPAWLDQNLSIYSEQTGTPKSIRPSLFPDRTSRGILGAALAMQITGTSIDITKLTEQILKGQLPKKLPLNITQTLNNGCQLLLDYSEPMTPFWQDLNHLAEQLESFLGLKRITVYEFDQNPLQAENWHNAEQKHNWQPEAGRPVLVASGLNIGFRYQPLSKDWQQFISLCQAQQVPLLLLFPFSKSNWPKDLGTYPIPIHWNPGTSAGTVYSHIGPGHKVNL